MEGPISTVGGVIKFAVSQVTNQQYNVKAGDEFLQTTLPTMYNSPAWINGGPSAIFLTWDEDNNNLSLGFGNEGNNVVLIVIPNPAAVANGMVGGVFVASDHYNHYSLQRTIEDSLGLWSSAGVPLPPLTNNDAYAEPLNEFWKTTV